MAKCNQLSPLPFKGLTTGTLSLLWELKLIEQLYFSSEALQLLSWMNCSVTVTWEECLVCCTYRQWSTLRGMYVCWKARRTCYDTHRIHVLKIWNRFVSCCWYYYYYYHHCYCPTTVCLTLSVQHFSWLWQKWVYQSVQCHTGLTHPSNFLTFGHSGTQDWVQECPNVTKLNRVG